MSRISLRQLACATLAAVCSLGSAYAGPKAYVVNSASPWLTVVDLGSRIVIGQIQTGMGSAELYVLPDNRTAFLTESAGNMLRKIDLVTGQTASVPVGITPASIIVSPKLDYAYVANQGSNDLSVVAINLTEPAALTFVKNIPVGVTPVQVNQSFDGKYLYTANRDSGDITVIDAVSLTVVNPGVPLPAGHPNQFAENPNGKAFIPAPDANAVYVFDMTTNAIVGMIPASNPTLVVFSPDNGKLFILTQRSTIPIYDASSLRDLGTLQGSGRGTNAVDMAITSDGKYAYVAYQGSNGSGSEVDVADLTALSLDPIATTVAANSQPISVSFDPNEDYVYVTLAGANQVVAVDPNTDRIVSTLQTGAIPLALVQLNQPYVPAGAVLDAAGYRTNIAGGAIVSIFGEGLVETPGSAATLPLPTALNGTQVLFNGVPAPLFFTSGLQINALVPASVWGQSTATMEILGPNGSDRSTITLSPAVSPGLFALNSAGSGPGAIRHALGYAIVDDQNPAKPGEWILLYASGLGPTNPSIDDGHAAAGETPITAVATVTIGGQDQTPYYAGLAPYFAGLYQINAQVPQLLPGTWPVTVTVDGITSNTVTVSVGKP